MRIVILSSRFPKRGKSIGGAEISALNVANGLSQRGHDVFVVTRKAEDLATGGFKLRQVGYFRYPSVFRYLSTASSMVKEIKKIKPDIIYCQTLYSESFAGVKAGRLLGIPVVARSVGAIYVTKSFFGKLMLKRVIRRSTKVLALTQHMKRMVLGYCGEADVGVIPEGVDHDFFSNFPRGNRKKDSILYVGRFSSVKCVDCLLKAFAIVEKKVPGASLTLIGEGELVAGLKALAKELGLKGARFLGIQKREVVARHMKSSSMLVLPSKSEGFPLVITEAMAAGLPIIATRIRGLPEIIRDGENGYLVESENPDQLAERMISLLKDGDKMKRFASNNIRKSEKYKWDVIVGQLLKEFEGLVGHKPDSKKKGKRDG